MPRIAANLRALSLVAWAVVGLLLAGCDSRPATGPQVSDQERKEMIRQDAEQILKERQQGNTRRPPR